MRHAIHEEADGRIKIFNDEFSENPRENFEYTSTLAIRGHLGEEEPDPEFDLSDCIWLPVYRYEHGNIVFNTTGFHCPWDSGPTGYIYETKANIRKEYGVQRISPKLKAQIEERLRTEVAVFSAWANGDVFGYEVDDGEDSCWGFYGYLEIDWDYMLEQAREALTA